MKFLRFFLFVALLLSAPLAARAADPIGQIVSYQGKLTDTAGAPVADGTQSLTFKIYENGTLVFTTAQSVASVGGVFNAFINVGSRVTFDPAKSYDLAISFNGVEVKHPIAAVPVAVNAVRATTADNATNATTADNATNATTADNATNATTATTANGLTLPLSQTASNNSPLLVITNSGNGNAIQGSSASSNGIGVSGNSTGFSGIGVSGNSTAFGTGVSGTSSGSGPGVSGSTSGGGYGVYGSNGNSNANGYAGYFNGRVNVTGNLNVVGTLSKGSGTFKIDDPLDPANKFLYHSFVESPDMMNIYNGIAPLDADGTAVVVMPDYFSALNKEFRYQLTCIGGYAPVYVAQELAGNRFKIAGGKAGLKVSWQITGIRHDAFADANRVQVEVEKTGDERGRYLYPQLFGQSADKGIAALQAPTAATAPTPPIRKGN